MTTSADLADVLRHPSRLDALLAREGEGSVAARADADGVTELLAWTRPDIAWLGARRRAAIVAESAREAQESRVFRELHRLGIPAAVVKGGAIARTHYPASWCRSRLDLDLLIGVDDRARAFDALGGLGYARAGRLPGEIVNHQEVFERELTPGLTHALDVHWEATNRALFVRRLPARDLLRRSRPAAWAGSLVRDLDPIDSLLLAAIHRAAHHPNDSRLIWTYDVWLLARSMDAASVTDFLDRARTLGVASLCARDIDEARTCFGGGGGALTDDAVARLAEAG